MEDCPLCDKKSFKLYITFCKTHTDTPLIVSTEHKSKWTEEEERMIKNLFPNRKIRWSMQSLPNHVHCHLE